MENKKGFTLVELLAVIAILAILVILALPNVINLYNRAQKETFLTEVKKIHSEAEKKYISSSINGNTIKTINSEDDSKLDMTGEKLQYCINLNNSGKVISMKVSNHKWIASLEDGKSIEDLTIDDLEDGNLDGYKCTGTSSVPVPPAVYCTYNGTLTQGTEYVQGQYTYRYKQEKNDVNEDNLSVNWKNMNNDGWGVALTNPNSTDEVKTDDVCTYINDIPVTSMAGMFALSQASSIDLSGLNTSNVTNMTVMFSIAQAKNLDFSKFDTSNVTNMYGMFAYNNASQLDLRSFNTKKVSNMRLMFSNIQAASVNLSSFDTSNVTNMYGMFAYSNPTTLDLSNFNTSKVTDMTGMFNNNKAETINGLNNFNTSKVSSMNCMFCDSQVKNINLSSFDTSNVTDMNGMFLRTKVATLNISKFNTRKVTNMSWLFAESQLTTIEGLDKLNTSNVTDMHGMFQQSQLEMIDLSNFDTSKVINMDQMFMKSQAAILDLSSFDTSSATSINNMFENCQNLKTIYASNKFVTDNVAKSPYMFYGSTNLVGGNGTKYNSSYIDKTYARIDTASTPGYFTLKNN